MVASHFILGVVEGRLGSPPVLSLGTHISEYPSSTGMSAIGILLRFGRGGGARVCGVPVLGTSLHSILQGFCPGACPWVSLYFNCFHMVLW